jgi:hypothetical protein
MSLLCEHLIYQVLRTLLSCRFNCTFTTAQHDRGLFTNFTSSNMGVQETSSAEDAYELVSSYLANGSHLFAEIFLIPLAVIQTFGKGSPGDEYKVSKEWVFRKGNLIFTLYDWKLTDLYDGGMWTPDELWASGEPFDLHVGSKEPATLEDVTAFTDYLVKATSVEKI